MAEDYEQLIPSIVGGTRHSSPAWPAMYGEEEGAVEDRVRAVFERTGLVPTREQYAQAAEGAPGEEEAAEPEAEEQAAPKRAAKKGE